MEYSVAIIGGGASGLMAAYSAALEMKKSGVEVSVLLLEKMSRPARKLMITGKGRCNFTNVKTWSDFRAHIRSGENIVRPAFHNLTPEKLISFFESYGMNAVVERGDRAYPASYLASDVVDTLVRACTATGVNILTDCEVSAIEPGYTIVTSRGKYRSRRIIIATGGLSYPTTGSSGDGYLFARGLGHSIQPTFPSLTALVPEGYKDTGAKGHIERETPLSEGGAKLCGVELKNIQATLSIDGKETSTEFGDIFFTDGGIEGPIGFQLSRKAVKSIVNGGRAGISLDLKPGVPLEELLQRVKTLWLEVDKDPRSKNLHEKQKCVVLLGKLLPRELVPGFIAWNPGIMTLERHSRTQTKLWVNLLDIAKALKCWDFPLRGYVGYERAVVTAGGVNCGEVVPKSLESRLSPGLYFCGEVLDIDCDTGGYNLQCAFATGMLAGECAAKACLELEKSENSVSL